MGVSLTFCLGDNTCFLLIAFDWPPTQTHTTCVRAHILLTHSYTHHPHTHPCKRAVHGNTKSGRVRDHHFVHTSLELEIKDSNDQQEAVVASSMPPGLSGCTSDHFLNRKNVENDPELEFVETEMFTNSGGARADKSNQQEVAEEQVVLQGIDLTKAVTFCIDVLTRVRDGIRTGLVIIDEGINTVDDYRRKLFSEEGGKVYEVMDIVKSVAETVDRIDQKIQYFKKAVTKPDSPERKELVQDIKNLAANRMKLMTKQVRKVVNFFASYVVKMLDQFKEYPPILIKNLKPLTDMIARVLQVGSECDNTLRNSHSTLPNALHRHSQTILHVIL